jgi:hypothetical protein
MVRPPKRSEPRPRAHAESPARRGIPAVYLLLALGLVVFVVSMPRFRAQVVRDNTLGARDMLLLVGEVAEERGHRDVVALLAEEASLRHRMRDARPAATVGRMRLHGYLLDDVALADGSAALAAWPVEFGRTGRDAWLCVDGRHVYRHPNGGRWTGEARPLRRADLTDGWQAAALPAADRFP